MFVALETMKKMKAGLQAAGLHPYLMMQPVTTLMMMKIWINIIMITMKMAMRIMITILTITFKDCLPVPRRREARDH